MGSHPELSLPQQPEKEPKEEPPPPGEPATLWRSVKDEPRSITSLVAAPRYLHDLNTSEKRDCRQSCYPDSMTFWGVLLIQFLRPVLGGSTM